MIQGHVFFFNNVINIGRCWSLECTSGGVLLFQSQELKADIWVLGNKVKIYILRINTLQGRGMQASAEWKSLATQQS